MYTWKHMGVCPVRLLIIRYWLHWYYIPKFLYFGFQKLRYRNQKIVNGLNNTISNNLGKMVMIWNISIMTETFILRSKSKQAYIIKSFIHWIYKTLWDSIKEGKGRERIGGLEKLMDQNSLMLQEGQMMFPNSTARFTHLTGLNHWCANYAPTEPLRAFA